MKESSVLKSDEKKNGKEAFKAEKRGERDSNLNINLENKNKASEKKTVMNNQSKSDKKTVEKQNK